MTPPRQDLGNNLRRALEKNEFVLYYQPQYSNVTKEMIGVEVLIRWIDPEKGVVPSNDFIPFAEESGLIYKINSWVIREVCTQAYSWISSR